MSPNIVFRYSAVRRQFAAQDGAAELPIIEYQLQQWRLFPYLAACYVMGHFAKTLSLQFIELRIGQMMKDDTDRQVRGAVAIGLV